MKRKRFYYGSTSKSGYWPCGVMPKSCITYGAYYASQMSLQTLISLFVRMLHPYPSVVLLASLPAACLPACLLTCVCLLCLDSWYNKCHSFWSLVCNGSDPRVGFLLDNFGVSQTVVQAHSDPFYGLSGHHSMGQSPRATGMTSTLEAPSGLSKS